MSDENKIIRFPGAVARLPAKTSADPIAKLTVGPLSFYCTNCGDTCHADFKKMIFKHVEFYCAACGNFFKITNPAFTNALPKTKK